MGPTKEKPISCRHRHQQGGYIVGHTYPASSPPHASTCTTLCHLLAILQTDLPRPSPEWGRPWAASNRRWQNRGTPLPHPYFQQRHWTRKVALPRVGKAPSRHEHIFPIAPARDGQGCARLFDASCGLASPRQTPCARPRCRGPGYPQTSSLQNHPKEKQAHFHTKAHTRATLGVPLSPPSCSSGQTGRKQKTKRKNLQNSPLSSSTTQTTLLTFSVAVAPSVAHSRSSPTVGSAVPGLSEALGTPSASRAVSAAAKESSLLHVNHPGRSSTTHTGSSRISVSE